MSLLCADNPSLPEFLETYDVELTWHPSLSTKPVTLLLQEIKQIIAEEQSLSILCIAWKIRRYTTHAWNSHSGFAAAPIP